MSKLEITSGMNTLSIEEHDDGQLEIAIEDYCGEFHMIFLDKKQIKKLKEYLNK